MTGGLGFVRDGMNSQKRNRNMLSDLKDNHFKSFKPKSDFFRNYKKTGRADPKVLAKIREQARINNRRDLSKRLILLLIALILVAIVAYLLPKLNEL